MISLIELHLKRKKKTTNQKSSSLINACLLFSSHSGVFAVEKGKTYGPGYLHLVMLDHSN